jgi:hypothetical protein
MRALWSGIVDDAAVFPPGNAPIDLAVRRHDEHRSAAYADVIGPLLVPTSAVSELAALTASRSEPLAVALVARPGVPEAEVETAVANALQQWMVRVVGVELGWVPGWRNLRLGDLPVVLEIPRGDEQDQALADLRMAVLEGWVVRGKFRTGATPTWPWPDEAELALVLELAQALAVPLKLTGGLHHAVRGAHPETPGGPTVEQHGFLNVLAAVHALATGSGRDHAARLLAVREARDLADVLTAWDDDAVRLTRTHLTAFGCCEVTDPVTELTELDLLPKD